MADIEIENLIKLDKAKLVSGQRMIKIGKDIWLPIGLGGSNPPSKPLNQNYSGEEENMLKTNPVYSYFSGTPSLYNNEGIEMKVEQNQVYNTGNYVGSDEIMVSINDLNAKYLVLRGCANPEINGDYIIVDDTALGDDRVWSNGTYCVCRSGDTDGWCITKYDSEQISSLKNSDAVTRVGYSLFTVDKTNDPYTSTGSIGWGSIDWNGGSFMQNRKLLLFLNSLTSTINVEEQSMKTSCITEKNKTIVILNNVTFTKVNAGFVLAGYVYNDSGNTGPILIGRTASAVEVKDSTSNSVANTPSAIYYSPSTKTITDIPTDGYEMFYWNGGTTNWVSGDFDSTSTNFGNIKKMTSGSTVLNAIKELLDLYYENFISFPAFEQFETHERYMVSGAGTNNVNSNNYYISFDGDDNYPEFLSDMYAVNYCYATSNYYLCGYVTQSLMQMHIIVPLNWDGTTVPLYFSFDNALTANDVQNWYVGSGIEPAPLVAINNTPNMLGVNGDISFPVGLNTNYMLVDPEQIGTNRIWMDETETYYITYTSSDKKWVISTIARPSTIEDGLFYINEENVIDPFIDSENSKIWTIVDESAVTINGDLEVIAGEATPPYNEFTINNFPYNVINGLYRSIDLEEDTTVYDLMMNVWNYMWGGTLSTYYAFSKIDGDMLCFAFNNSSLGFIRREYLNNGWWSSFDAMGEGRDWNIVPRTFIEYWNYGGEYTINRSWVDGEM